MNRRNPIQDSDASASSEQVTRPKRKPITHRSVLNIEGKDPAYEYRWVNDRTGNVEMFEDNGWEKVYSSELKRVGDGRVSQATPEGSLATAVVNSYDGTRAVVMKIKKEWFLEDQALYEKSISDSELALQPNASDGGYGRLDITRK